MISINDARGKAADGDQHADGILDHALGKGAVAIGFVYPRLGWSDTRGLREVHGKATGRKEGICTL